MPAVDERQAAARILWHDLLRQADKDNKIMRNDADYADRFRDFSKFYLWLCLHSYKPGMALARRNPCDPFYPRNCYLKEFSPPRKVTLADPRAFDTEREQARKKGRWNGLSNTRLYGIWEKMIRRCTNPKDEKHWPDYGGRGITVCNEWKKSFPVFVEWAWAHGYNPELTLERIDVDKGYNPQNCRWASAIEQMLNTQETRKTYRNIRLRVSRMRELLTRVPEDAVVTLIARRDCLPDFNDQEDDYPAIPERERVDTRRNHG